MNMPMIRHGMMVMGTAIFRLPYYPSLQTLRLGTTFGHSELYRGLFESS